MLFFRPPVPASGDLATCLQTTFTVRGKAGRLSAGTTLTVISNTAATPIVGTFANLPDHSIVTIGGNHFQVNYEGGDGNDLTLTVVP